MSGERIHDALEGTSPPSIPRSRWAAGPSGVTRGLDQITAMQDRDSALLHWETGPMYQWIDERVASHDRIIRVSAQSGRDLRNLDAYRVSRHFFQRVRTSRLCIVTARANGDNLSPDIPAANPSGRVSR